MRGDSQRLAVGAFAGDDDEIAHPAFDDLRFDAGHEDVAVAAVRLDAVDDYAGVTGALGAALPGTLTPAKLDDQVVITVRLLGTDITEAVAGNVQQAIFDGEYLARIVVAGVV